MTAKWYTGWKKKYKSTKIFHRISWFESVWHYSVSTKKLTDCMHEIVLQFQLMALLFIHFRTICKLPSKTNSCIWNPHFSYFSPRLLLHQTWFRKIILQIGILHCHTYFILCLPVQNLFQSNKYFKLLCHNSSIHIASHCARIKCVREYFAQHTEAHTLRSINRENGNYPWSNAYINQWCLVENCSSNCTICVSK